LHVRANKNDDDDNNILQLKTIFFVHLRSQQKRTEKVISNYQIYSVVILTLLFSEQQS